ncbi:hypothetical protein BUALT_Bualt10G0010600 [Buddleja alternifolia]|uniref:HAT C-terminal dimerisation domain-containing protein n=1 Tax=Buddleja alternifolia TaxID=168488 RepID=A0AAV6X360_9LAMI|nr:hypothetical protein BUALT_Bualt10G0010600 [Buddleja alternifolia]
MFNDREVGAFDSKFPRRIYWTASPARVEKFGECARQLQIGSTKKLSIDCKTRWNSTNLMLETAIIYKDVFPRLKERDKYYHSLPTDEDWSRAAITGDSSSARVSLGSMIRGGASGVTDASADDSLEEYDLFAASRFANTTSLTSELDGYLEKRILPRMQNFDVLSWWKVNGLKYPTLQAMARDILVIPISMVASESVFSTSGRLLSPHRSRLHPSTVEALRCSRRWLWKETNVVNIE